MNRLKLFINFNCKCVLFKKVVQVMCSFYNERTFSSRSLITYVRNSIRKTWIWSLSYKRILVLKRLKCRLNFFCMCIISFRIKLYCYDQKWGNELSRILRLVYSFIELNFLYRIGSLYSIYKPDSIFSPISERTKEKKKGKLRTFLALKKGLRIQYFLFINNQNKTKQNKLIFKYIHFRWLIKTETPQIQFHCNK